MIRLVLYAFGLTLLVVYAPLVAVALGVYVLWKTAR